jgi:hypothetical protein
MYQMIITTHWAWPRTIVWLVRRDGVLRRQWCVAQYLVDIYWKRLFSGKNGRFVNLKPGKLVTGKWRVVDPRHVASCSDRKMFSSTRCCCKSCGGPHHPMFNGTTSRQDTSVWSCWQCYEVNTGATLDDTFHISYSFPFNSNTNV